MTKYRAALIHLAICITVVGITLLFFAGWIYPIGLYKPLGALEIVSLIVLVDLCLGPILTLVVFKTGKKTLVFDMAVIALIQLAALIYGIYSLYESRPVFAVYSNNQLVLITNNDIPEQMYVPPLAAGLDRIPLIGIELVGVKIPDDPNISFELTMDALSGGADITAKPPFYIRFKEGLANDGMAIQKDKTICFDLVVRNKQLGVLVDMSSESLIKIFDKECSNL